MHIFLIIMIAISLSMDAFSLALAYGTLNISNKNKNELSIIVGIYHFIMPMFGMLVGNKIINLVPISSSLLIFLVLTFIGIEMIFESRKEFVNVKIMPFRELLLFGFAVSVDSFSVGMGFSFITRHYISCSLLFSIFSTLFTYLGLELGSKINKRVGSISTLIGGMLLILIGIIYLF